MEYILIDPRMRNVEKNTLKYLGYELVPIIFLLPKLEIH